MKEIIRFKVARNVFIILAFVLAFVTYSSSIKAQCLKYDRNNAIIYASEWCNNVPPKKQRNPAYNSVHHDCANFVSQCIAKDGGNIIN